MANLVHVAGLALIKISFGGSGYLELGYTRNGADITREGYFLDVPGDENGGDEGPPIEIQFLGAIARVRLELTKFDMDTAERLSARVAGGQVGVPSSAGTLLLANVDGTKSIDVLINTPIFPIHFPVVVARQPIEINKGTKFSTFVCELECHKDQSTGILWDRLTTAH